MKSKEEVVIDYKNNFKVMKLIRLLNNNLVKLEKRVSQLEKEKRT